MAGNLLVEDVSDDGTGNQANDGRQGNGSRRSGERDTGNEDDSLDTLTEDGDEGKNEHGVLLKGSLEPSLLASLERRIKGLGELDTPLSLHLTNSEKSSSHDGNDDGGEEAESAFIVVFIQLPRIGTDGIEDADKCSGDDHADEETDTCAEPDLEDGGLVGESRIASMGTHLASQALIHLDVAVGTMEGLLEEGKQDRDDDNRLKGLSKDNEEDGNRKDIDSHDVEIV